MRLIPGKIKVKLELFKGISLPDVVIGVIFLGLATLVFISNIPGRIIIAGVFVVIGAFLELRIDDEPNYKLILNIFKKMSLPSYYEKMAKNPSEQAGKKEKGKSAEKKGKKDTDKENPDGSENTDSSEDGAENKETEAPKAREENTENPDGEHDEYAEDLVNELELESDIKKEQMLSEAAAAVEEEYIETDPKKLKEIIKEEDRILKSKTATQEEKDAVWLARAKRSAKRKEQKTQKKDKKKGMDISDIMPYTGIKDNAIEYGGQYVASVIEITPVDFRFFSQYRRNNSIENCLGKIIRGINDDYGFNIVKIDRPINYDAYLTREKDKFLDLRRSYENAMLNEDELRSRSEIEFSRIAELTEMCKDNKVVTAYYYLVLFEKDIRQLNIVTSSALSDLEMAELPSKRLNNKELAVFLKYTNEIDFDEREIEKIAPEDYVRWSYPKSIRVKVRNVVVGNMITHNLKLYKYPSLVGDAWLASVMSIPGTKVVVKCHNMDRDKAIRGIDHSLQELRSRFDSTGIDSKRIELQSHIDSLSDLLVTLQGDNETLLETNIYVTIYDYHLSKNTPVVGAAESSDRPDVVAMKKSIRRLYSEQKFKMNNMDFQQHEAFIGSQVSNYDPKSSDGRGMPSNTVAATYPWIFAHISDKGGIHLGQSDGIPVFIDFFRRDNERINSNMVIIGKSGSGKSYATKSLLSNLAAEDAKIFILDPENEYQELAGNLNGKIINAGNALQGRLNPFQIITALDDDETGEDGVTGSYSTHLQFLEEFLRQIFPDCEKDALEYLNTLVERMYIEKGIGPETNLASLSPEDYPIFDDLYDVVLDEFERTDNEYLRNLLRSLMNYVGKFATGGRNANIWNGHSTLSTDENFTVFNFQSLLANRNTLIANAQMLLILKYIDNEVIKNRDYNTKYNMKRKIVVVIDEAHVFIDTKFPVALDFMFQLAKRIRKYNGMQIVITQNIKDFVGSEEIARKSTAIINACQYSFIFALAPNDITDLCKLYEKAGGINEIEQEQITSAQRGQAFTIMSATSRSSFKVEVPNNLVRMFERADYVGEYFGNEEGMETWNELIAPSRELHDQAQAVLDAGKVVRIREKRPVKEIVFDEQTEEEYNNGLSGKLPEGFFDEVSEDDFEKENSSFFDEVSEEEYNTGNSSGGGFFDEVSEEDYNRMDDLPQNNQQVFGNRAAMLDSEGRSIMSEAHEKSVHNGSGQEGEDNLTKVLTELLGKFSHDSLMNEIKRSVQEQVAAATQGMMYAGGGYAPTQGQYYNNYNNGQYPQYNNDQYNNQYANGGYYNEQNSYSSYNPGSTATQYDGGYGNFSTVDTGYNGYDGGYGYNNYNGYDGYGNEQNLGNDEFEPDSADQAEFEEEYQNNNNYAGNQTVNRSISRRSGGNSFFKETLNKTDEDFSFDEETDEEFENLNENEEDFSFDEVAGEESAELNESDEDFSFDEETDEGSEELDEETEELNDSEEDFSFDVLGDGNSEEAEETDEYFSFDEESDEELEELNESEEYFSFDEESGEESEELNESDEDFSFDEETDEEPDEVNEESSEAEDDFDADDIKLDLDSDEDFDFAVDYNYNDFIGKMSVSEGRDAEDSEETADFDENIVGESETAFDDSEDYVDGGYDIGDFGESDEAENEDFGQFKFEDIGESDGSASDYSEITSSGENYGEEEGSMNVEEKDSFDEYSSYANDDLGFGFRTNENADTANAQDNPSDSTSDDDFDFDFSSDDDESFDFENFEFIIEGEGEDEDEDGYVSSNPDPESDNEEDDDSLPSFYSSLLSDLDEDDEDDDDDDGEGFDIMKLMEERASREDAPETENYAENPIEKMKAENKTVVAITLKDLASYLNHQRELKHQALRQKAAEVKGE